MRYINAKAVKELALHTLATTRPAWGANRVSQEFLEKIDAQVHALVVGKIHQAPSLGKTLK